MTAASVRVGLVVGKFCPLHLGHQALIDFARARCERLVIISYTKPEFEGCEPAVRARWLEVLYPDCLRLVVDDDLLAGFAARAGKPLRRLPHNDDPADVHRRFTGWLCLEMLGTVVDAVFTSEDYGDGFAAALAEVFEAELGRPHPVQHICFDRDRALVPVSGTLARADPAARRRYVSDVVAADFCRPTAGPARP